jgi:hypothetical protein
MPNSKPNKEELEKLFEQIKQDQRSSSPDEKRVKLGVSLKKAVKKIVQAAPPKKKSK